MQIIKHEEGTIFKLDDHYDRPLFACRVCKIEPGSITKGSPILDLHRGKWTAHISEPVIGADIYEAYYEGKITTWFDEDEEEYYPILDTREEAEIMAIEIFMYEVETWKKALEQELEKILEAYSLIKEQTAGSADV